MRTHVSEDKSVTVSAKSKRHSIVGRTLGPIKKKKKEKNVGRDWKEANET